MHQHTPWPGFATAHTDSRRPEHGSQGLWWYWHPPGYQAFCATLPWQHLHAIQLESHPPSHCSPRWGTHWFLESVHESIRIHSASHSQLIPYQREVHICVWVSITKVIRSLQDGVVELLVQLQVCVWVGVCVISVFCCQCGWWGRLGARATKGMHGRRTLRTWTMKYRKIKEAITHNYNIKWYIVQLMVQPVWRACCVSDWLQVLVISSHHFC